MEKKRNAIFWYRLIVTIMLCGGGIQAYLIFTSMFEGETYWVFVHAFFAGIALFVGWVFDSMSLAETKKHDNL